MRDIMVITIILSLVIYGSHYMYKYYSNTKDEFESKLEDMQDDLAKGTMSEEKIKELEQVWLNKENTLIVFQAHNLVGDIEEDLYECFHYYRKREEDDYELAKQKVISGLDDLVKRECVSFVNIF